MQDIYDESNDDRVAKHILALHRQKEEEMARLAEAKLEILNEKDPTTRDKIVSVLPYLFPLMDSLQFARFFIVDNIDNPFVTILGLLFAAYRSIPFSGFIAFFALIHFIVESWFE